MNININDNSIMDRKEGNNGNNNLNKYINGRNIR